MSATGAGAAAPGSLVLGTTNAGKVRELAALLEPHGIGVVSLRESGGVTVEETGATFAENAKSACLVTRALAGVETVTLTAKLQD